MLQVQIQASDGTQTLVQAPDESTIGKSAQAEVRLSGWRVAKEHARLIKTPSGILLEDLGSFGGIEVNGERIDTQYGPLKSSDIISIASYTLKVIEIGAASGIVQAASTRSRSDTAAYRNQLATQRLAESRQRAEVAQHEAEHRSASMPAIQAESMGMNLGPMLRAQADQRRSERFLRAEKLAMEAPVKMLFPLIAFIFPCTFIVLFFPIVMKFMHSGI